MFGSICFMLNGNMCTGAWNGSLIARPDKRDHPSTPAEPDARPADVNGRVMKGWALVDPVGIESDDRLAWWVDRAAKFARSLPAK